MPEGDTILRAARAMHRALAGKEILAAASSLPEVASALRTLVGHRVLAVEAMGKNHLVRFDDQRTLHTHMKMTGSWHLYRPGERWQRGPAFARVVLTFADVVAVCFAAPVVRLLSPRDRLRDDDLRALGPDILTDDFDANPVISRMRARDDGPIGDVVVDQRCVAGIGNIFKSESLFAEGIDPFAATSSLDDATLLRLVSRARALMRKSANEPTDRPRTTAPFGGYWVYSRQGEPCRRCGTGIEMRRQGDLGRSTYYCPRCQRVTPRP